MRAGFFRKLFFAASIAVVTPAAGQAQAADPVPAWESAEQTEAPPESDYEPVDAPTQTETPAPVADTVVTGETSASERASAAASGRTVARKDVFTAAEGVFGKGAEGLGDLIEKLLREQGEPSAYITGREAGGAFVVGVRYGSGILHHGVEGDRPIHWTGPSLGFDFGADASKVFVLVYNLYDSQRIFKRYPAAEGNAYVVGGFTASYLRRGDVVLIPVRLGVGLRLGINGGYMRFSERARWLPF